MTEAFETFGGVPEGKSLTDKYETVMDEARTEIFRDN